MRPIGIPPSPDGLCSRVSEECGKGKTVESVPKGVRLRIRRAMTADSYDVGILNASLAEEGFLKMYWGEVGIRVDAAIGRKARRFVACILKSGNDDLSRDLVNKRIQCMYKQLKNEQDDHRFETSTRFKLLGRARHIHAIRR